MYEPYVYDITKMRNGICLNAVYAVYALNAHYMPLFTWEMFHVWLIYIYESIKMASVICLNAPYMIINNRELYVWVLYIWYSCY